MEEGGNVPKFWLLVKRDLPRIPTQQDAHVTKFYRSTRLINKQHRERAPTKRFKDKKDRSKHAFQRRN